MIKFLAISIFYVLFCIREFFLVLTNILGPFCLYPNNEYNLEPSKMCFCWTGFQ